MESWTHYLESISQHSNHIGIYALTKILCCGKADCFSNSIFLQNNPFGIKLCFMLYTYILYSKFLRMLEVQSITALIYFGIRGSGFSVHESSMGRGDVGLLNFWYCIRPGQYLLMALEWN